MPYNHVQVQKPQHVSFMLKCDHFPLRGLLAPPFPSVNGSIIGEPDKVKYLGHIICNEMSDDDDTFMTAMVCSEQCSMISTDML